MEPKAFYDSELNSLEELVARKKRADTSLSIGRGISMLAALASFYAYFILSFWMFIPLGIALLVTFGFVLRVHMRVRQQLRHSRIKLSIVKTELAYLNGDLDGIPDGAEFRDENHPYANDLDVFGKGSLYQRVARCKTSSGKVRLAEELKELRWEELSERQEAIKELSVQAPELLEYRTILEQLNVADIKGRVEQWVKDSREVPLLYRRPISLALAAIFPLALLAIVVTGSWDRLDVLIYLFILNLIVLGQGSQFLKRQYQQLDRIHKDTMVYGRLIEHFSTWKVESTPLREIADRFSAGGRRADQELQGLSRILERFDSMNNVVVLVALNGTFLFHIHVLHALLTWKRRNRDHLLDWLRALEELESWVSKAQFAFHHPSYSYPVIQEGMTFKAEGLGHPFISSEKRVDNDIQFDDFKMMVLTGSNMAGKSTFLRSIGVNMILASTGAPVCARSLELSKFQLLSSMKPQDSINEDRSYFQAEVLRLRMILDRLDPATPSFVLFDEILRGTNSDDKRNGTRAFLDGLTEKHLLGVIATHDIEIADGSGRDNEVFKNYFFESTFTNGELQFDYILREGVCRTPNATQLLIKHGVIKPT